MALEPVLARNDLPQGSKKTVKVGDTEILLIHAEDGKLYAVEAKCPHAGAPLEKGAVCNGRLICPWHTGTFELADGALVEPPPLRSLRHYAVEMQGDQIVVDPEAQNQPSLANHDDQTPASPHGEHLHFVTIGAGAAATAAVCTLRQAGFAGRITMIDPRESEPVDRTVLSKMALAGEMPLDKLPLLSPEEQTKLRINRVDARVDSIEGENGMLRLNDGVSFGCDAALLAPGGVPQWLAIAGQDSRHVFTIRHKHDVASIDRMLHEIGDGARAVLIGDSFIAFEAASALKTRGLDVTLVCRSPQPFSKRFGEAPAQSLVGLHQANGVTLRLGEEAREITPTTVELKSGDSLPADLVIVAVGVKPATDFEHDFELEEDGSLSVDRSLKLAPKLWVAGDVATVDGVRIEHWRLAQQHGRTAAFGMAGLAEAGPDTKKPSRYDGVPFFWTFHFGKRFGYVGHAAKWDSLQVDGALGEANFLAYYLVGDKVAAVFGCGRDSAMAMLAESLRQPLTLAQARAAAASAST